MKKLFLWMMTYFWGLMVGVPFVFKLFYGRFPRIYKAMGEVHEGYMSCSALIMTAFTILVIFIIYNLNIAGSKEIKTKLEVGNWYYYFALISTIVMTYLISGGVLGAAFQVRMDSSGRSFLSLFTLFFSAQVLMVVFLVCKRENVKPFWTVGLYLILTILNGSRSGALFTISIIMCTVITRKDVFEKNKGLIRKVILFLVIVAPILFVISTNNRGGTTAGESTRDIIEFIAGRCSNLELDGMILYKTESGQADMELFDEKYSIVNQCRLVVNSFLPGNLFEGDVNPNQYYRPIVGYLTKRQAVLSYTSINMTFPVYMIVKYGFLGFPLAIAIVIIFYIICCKLANHIISYCFATIVFTEIVAFFDWVMVAMAVKRVLLTWFCLSFAQKYMRHLVQGLGLNFRFRKISLFEGRRIRIRIGGTR